MSFRAWCYVAAFGLTLASVGQAQEQTSPSQEGRTAQESKAEPPPFAIPVQIIEEQEAAEVRERSEAEARQREIDDLAAQQGMNEATQAMNEATQRMALYSLVGTITVVIGTALLIWTLMLTRQANRAAQAAVDVTREMGVAQMQAYVYVTWARLYNVGDAIQARVEVRNVGQTPAKSVNVFGQTDVVDPADVVPSPAFDRTAPGRDWGAVGSNTEVVVPVPCKALEDNFRTIEQHEGRLTIRIKGRVRYLTMFDDLYESEFSFHTNNALFVIKKTDNGSVAWEPIGMSREPVALPAYRYLGKYKS